MSEEILLSLSQDSHLSQQVPLLINNASVFDQKVVGRSTSSSKISKYVDVAFYSDMYEPLSKRPPIKHVWTCLEKNKTKMTIYPGISKMFGKDNDN